MKITLANPKTAALIGFLLALPFMWLFLQFMLGIEPSLGPFDPLIQAEGSRLGTWIFLVFLFLLLAGFILSLLPVVRSLRSGSGLTSHPFNLLITALILAFFLALVAAIIIDQYPCWIGIPNCD